jgi:spore maturation protein CgeB
LFPIATNVSRFNENITPKSEYLCDYCFTGSYWNNPREIMDMLEPESIPYEFKLFGKNWEKIDKFKNYYQGFISYSNLPKVYASTKIVIDDANKATKKYGAVNSRVFDALACGTLVLTNGKKGAEDTFKGKLPVFNTKTELNNLIEYYLSNNDERTTKIKELQKFVLLNHTYTNRANILKERLNSYRNQ